MVTEKLTPYGLVVGLIPDEEAEAPSEAVEVVEKEEAVDKKPAAKKSTKRVSK